MDNINIKDPNSTELIQKIEDFNMQEDNFEFKNYENKSVPFLLTIKRDNFRQKGQLSDSTDIPLLSPGSNIFLQTSQDKLAFQDQNPGNKIMENENIMVQPVINNVQNTLVHSTSSIYALSVLNIISSKLDAKNLKDKQLLFLNEGCLSH